jgi:hypothetical protein
MSVVIDGNQAKVHWLSNTHNNGCLTNEQMIFYVTRDGKLGQAGHGDSYVGLSPSKAFERRYAGQKSAMITDFIADDIFVFNKADVADTNPDNGCRKFINTLHKKELIPFSANVGSIQQKNTNSEALINYDRDNHLDMLTNSIKQYLGLETSFNTKEPISWRYGQAESVNEISTRILYNGRCLFAAYTGYGKTKIALGVTTQVSSNGGIVLVTTPITDTKKSFEENINNFHFGTDRNRKLTYMDSREFAKHSVLDLFRRTKKGEVIIIVLTVQDLRYAENNDAVDTKTQRLRAKYNALSGKVSLWIRDEGHLQYGGEVTSQRFSNIKARYVLDLTATPYNLMDEYREDEIVSRPLLWGLKYRKYTNIPSISIDAINTPMSNVNPEISGLFSVEEGYDGRKLFLRQNNNFVHRAELLKIFDLMYHNTLSKQKNPFSIVNDTQLSDFSKKCGLWVLPGGQAGDGADEYIPALAEMYNLHSNSYVTSSYALEKECPKNMTIGDYVESLVIKYGNVIILTCEKFITGTDIPCLGHVVLFTKINNITPFEQLLGRPIRQYPGKDAVKMYCMTPAMELKVMLGRLAKANSRLGIGSEYEFLDCVPLTEHTLDGSRSIGAEEILATTQQFFKQLSRDRLPTVSLETRLASTDLSVFDNINLNTYKKCAPKVIISEDNGARVKNKISVNPVTGNSHTNKERARIALIANVIQSVMTEAKWVSYSMDNYEYSTVLNHHSIRTMFPDAIDAVHSVIEDNVDIKNMVIKNLKDKEMAYRGLSPEEVYDDIFMNNELKRNLGLVYVPFDVATQVVSKLSKKLNRDNTVILVINALNGTFALELKKRFPKARIICGEFFSYFKSHLLKLGFEVADMSIVEGKVHITGVDDMKFDVIVGNSPYQMKRGNSDATIAIWDRFVLKSFELLNENGYLSMVHPAGWRNASGRFTGTRDLLLSKQMEYLEIHNEKDGLQTFGAKTRYDWYILKNTENNNNSTVVKFEDKSLLKVNLSDLPFIPNHSYNQIKNLIADSDQERVEILHSYSAYFCRGKKHRSINHVVEEKTSTHKYPVVYTVNISGGLTLKYSSINSNGHFGIPKVILMPATGTGKYIDIKGEYGLTQFVFAIADEPANLPLIKRALENKKFENLMTACSVGLNGYNHKVISTFRKDFWKEFV